MVFHGLYRISVIDLNLIAAGRFVQQTPIFRTNLILFAGLHHVEVDSTFRTVTLRTSVLQAVI